MTRFAVIFIIVFVILSLAYIACREAILHMLLSSFVVEVANKYEMSEDEIDDIFNIAKENILGKIFRKDKIDE